MTNRFSNQITSRLLAVVTFLALTPAVTFAATPAGRSLPKSAANRNAAAAANCMGWDQGWNHGNPGVHPPCSKPYGLTMGEWSAKWWQWVFSIPLETNPQLQGIPPLGPSVNCSQGQSGPVWFLAEGFGGTAVRECMDSIPPGVSLFFPVSNIFFGVIGFDCIHQGAFAPGTYPFSPVNDCFANPWQYPDLGIAPQDQSKVHSYQQLIDYVGALLDDPGPIRADVDGVPIRDLSAYRAKAPMFSVTTPSHNILGFSGIGPYGTGIADTYSPNGSDGYWVMLNPLTTGFHTVHFTAGDWLDVTYRFTVAH